MTTAQLTQLRKDITARRSGGPLTDLEGREYKRMMKRVCEADPFIRPEKGTPKEMMA